MPNDNKVVPSAGSIDSGYHNDWPVDEWRRRVVVTP